MGIGAWGLKFYPDSSLTCVSEKFAIFPFYVNVFPTPSMRKFSFSIYDKGKSQIRLRIFDLQGRRIEEKVWHNDVENQSNDSRIIHWDWTPGKNLSAGAYFGSFVF